MTTRTLTDEECAERNEYERGQTARYVEIYRSALMLIVSTAQKNGEDCSYLIAKNALSSVC